MITISSLSAAECRALSSCLRKVGGFLSDGYSFQSISGKVGSIRVLLKHARNGNSLVIHADLNSVVVSKDNWLINEEPIEVPFEL